MIGARFWAIKSAMDEYSVERGREERRRGLAHGVAWNVARLGGLGQFLDQALRLGLHGSLVAAAGVLLVQFAAQDRNALDQLAQPLECEQDEAEEDEALGRPDREAAGIRRNL